ncbi:Glycine/D-amino acid oxidase [Paenibacillus uliginis N3/975]|uniref:Glycine/D-amino acid oxidase n=1 Tax=Paenibacillus uliginis N3/975 TaxID=1313296 RepID=A0A1X7GUS3_9BACL|nr:FAD-dependent oxidoreductase [Paenibacillus uliginis]SMF75061.1 Glycine/D-amino acid oxidase [Paenibacillus uliginis N3/975]
MKLTGGNTPWSGQDIQRFSQLESNLSCDVLVIGGGISGALVSYILSKQGADTILLEKGCIGKGSTSANTGLLHFMNDDTLTELIQTLGEHKGTGFYRMCERSVNRLSEIASSLSVDTEFRHRSSLYYASTEDDAGKIRNEYDTLTRHGFNVEYWDRQTIKSHFPFSKPAAIYTQRDAEVNPYKLVHGLVSDAVHQGLRVFEHSGTENIEYSDNGATVKTKHGSIHARILIWAAGYETQEWKPDRIASLKSTYAIMTEPIQDLSSWYERALIWESSRPYLYMRTTQDNRIMAGGLDEPLHESGCPDVNLTTRSRRLLKDIHDLFPELGKISVACSWAGVFASTQDGIPLIGRHPHFPHSYFIEGYGGSGTVYSMLAADLLAEVANGSEPEELNWFSLTRSLKTNSSCN